MAAICVDAGTTMVKTVYFDDDGHASSVVRQATVVHRGAGGSSEQDMYAVWDAVVYTIRSVVHQIREPVRFIAFTGQGDGCWLVGKDGRPTGPAILWNDARAAALVDAWDDAGVLERAYRINGTLGFPGTPAAILAWLREHDPDRLSESHRMLSCDGWMFHRFTGEFAMDESDAASPFLDIRTRQYSPALLDIYGMSWAEPLLPELRDDEHRVGRLGEAVATELRLPAGLPVVMAPFDIPATALGIGAVEAGQACTILGTTLSTGTVLAVPDTDGPPAGMMLPAGEGYVRSLAAMAGSDVINWAMQMLGLDHPNWLSDLAAAVPPGAGGLFLHPYLSPAGERAPIRSAIARGSLIGMSLEHTRNHIARAVLEGLSYVVRDCLTFTPNTVTELRLCGGGANSKFWCQLLADATGIPTARSIDAEIGARGAFLSALVALGEQDSNRTAAERFVDVSDVFEPDPQAAAQYDTLFADFLALRAQLGEQWPGLAAVRYRLTQSN